MAHNGQGFVQVGDFDFRQPVTAAKLLIKSLKYIQMFNRIPSSWNWCKIVAQKLRLTLSSPTCTKPHVVGRLTCQEPIFIRDNLQIVFKEDGSLKSKPNILQKPSLNSIVIIRYNSS